MPCLRGSCDSLVYCKNGQPPEQIYVGGSCHCIPPPQASDDDIPALARAWEDRHKLINPKEPNGEEPANEPWSSKCSSVGFCICSPRGQLISWFWASAMRRLKEKFTGEQQKLLKNGSVALIWRTTEEPRSCVCTCIPLLYLRPWRPTLQVVGLCERSRALISQLQDEADNAQIGDVFLTATLEPGRPPSFFTPWQFLDTLELDNSYQVLYATLSQRAVPFPRSAGHVQMQLLPGVDLVWQGAEVERERRARRRRAAPFQDIHIGVVPNPNDVANDEEGVPPLAAQEVRSHSSEDEGPATSSSSSSSPDERSSSSSTSSSSSSSTSSDDSVGANGIQNAIPGADNMENALVPVGEAAEPAQHVAPDGVVRVQRAESYEWGAFRLTYKPPCSYQATCRYHHRHAPTKCTKLASWGVDEAGGAERVQRGLKLWCLRALDHDTKSSHQGRRGLPAFSAAENALSELDMERRLANMPGPPD